MIFVNCSQEIWATNSRPAVTAYSNVKIDLDTTPTSNFDSPQPLGWNSFSPLLVSQTQGDIDKSSILGSDDDDKSIAVPSNTTVQVNTVFGETDDYLSADTETIIDTVM